MITLFLIFFHVVNLTRLPIFLRASSYRGSTRFKDKSTSRGSRPSYSRGLWRLPTLIFLSGEISIVHVNRRESTFHLYGVKVESRFSRNGPVHLGRRRVPSTETYATNLPTYYRDHLTRLCSRKKVRKVGKNYHNYMTSTNLVLINMVSEII